ncbi:hypothetical protein ACQEVY_00780 [Streptomyces sp. CA-288835]|uniref:hypothetical protein n=1 Tax=Streptomyces sp. CA-288835 TaxID=3240069 RepID=UPI003D94C5D7
MANNERCGGVTSASRRYRDLRSGRAGATKYAKKIFVRYLSSKKNVHTVDYLRPTGNNERSVVRRSRGLRMGRKLNPLPDDGRPLTVFVQSLRSLWEEADAPPFTKLAETSGYPQPRLSELFNAKRVPPVDFLRDVVQALAGDPGPWLVRLKNLEEAEAEWQAAAARQGDSAEARIARLEHENETLRALTKHPESVIARAKSADEAAGERIEKAAAQEAQVRTLLSQVQEQFRQLHERLPAAQRQADTVVAVARADADRHELEGRIEHDKIIQEANDRAKELIRKATERATEIEQGAIEKAKEHRANAAESVDRLVKEGDRYRAEAEQAAKQAQAERENMERRARIEIERLVREAQRQLEAAGTPERAEVLEILLRDFNIGDSHVNVTGRHARRSTASQPESERDAQEAPNSAATSSPAPVPLPRRRSSWPLPRPRR